MRHAGGPDPEPPPALPRDPDCGTTRDVVRFAVGRVDVACDTSIAGAVREMLAAGTLYEYASRHPAARALAGRGVAYAIPLPGLPERAVVRHNRHGGLFAPLTGDVFLAPTRAPLELAVSRRLIANGVATPAVLAYAVYPAPFGFRRVDVLTREIPSSFDLSAALVSADAEHRRAALAATARLVRSLSAAGARHADLNVKNVLLRVSRHEANALEALVLDLDRVTFDAPDRVVDPNLARLLRSARKWRERHGARVTQGELDELARLVRAPLAAASTSS